MNSGARLAGGLATVAVLPAAKITTYGEHAGGRYGLVWAAKCVKLPEKSVGEVAR